MEILGKKRENQRTFFLDKGMSDALRDYCKRRWPHHTAKYVAREFNLTLDQGRSIAGGTATKTLVEKCIKHGGLLLGILLMEEVTGQRIADLFREIRAGYDENNESARAIFGEGWPLGGARGHGPSVADPVGHDRRRPTRRRVG